MPRYVWILALLGVLTACGSQQPAPKGVKVGKPYVISGKTYYPAYDDTYDKTGTASWYGPGFHGKYTANGEVFDQNDLTAAHPTLPMPSIVRVTNLENGRSLIVRINDRGPFKANRIIDLSKKSAQKLGIQGLAKVRVQFLKPETEQYIASMQGAQRIDMATYNQREEDAKEAALVASTQPSAEIVESTVASSGGGQTVTAAAPVLSVGSGDLDNSNIRVAEVQPVELYKEEPPLRLIREAAADDDVRRNAPATPVGREAEPAPVTQAAAEAEIEPGAILLSAPENPAPAAAPIKSAAAEPATPPAPRMAPASSSSASGNYFIQAGSFAAEENAHKLRQRLASLSEVLVERVDMSGRTWWRVRVGPFNDKYMADTKLAEVRSAGVPDARIVHQ